jgi:hypothetical protein
MILIQQACTAAPNYYLNSTVKQPFRESMASYNETMFWCDERRGTGVQKTETQFTCTGCRTRLRGLSTLCVTTFSGSHFLPG